MGGRLKKKHRKFQKPRTRGLSAHNPVGLISDFDVDILPSLKILPSPSSNFETNGNRVASSGVYEDGVRRLETRYENAVDSEDEQLFDDAELVNHRSSSNDEHQFEPTMLEDIQEGAWASHDLEVQPQSEVTDSKAIRIPHSRLTTFHHQGSQNIYLIDTVDPTFEYMQVGNSINFEPTVYSTEVQGQAPKPARIESHPKSRKLTKISCPDDGKIQTRNLKFLIQDYCRWLEVDVEDLPNESAPNEQEKLKLRNQPWVFYCHAYNGLRDVASVKSDDQEKGRMLLSQALDAVREAFANPTERLLSCVFLYYFLACEDIEPAIHQAFTKSLYDSALDTPVLGYSHPLTRILGIFSITNCFCKVSETEIARCVVEALRGCWNGYIDPAYEASELLIRSCIQEGKLTNAHQCCDETIQFLTEQPNRDPSYIRRIRRLKGRVFFAEGNNSSARAIFESLLHVWKVDGMPPTFTKEWMVYEDLARLEEVKGRFDIAKQHWEDAEALSGRSYKGGSNSRRIVREKNLCDAMQDMSLKN